MDVGWNILTLLCWSEIQHEPVSLKSFTFSKNFVEESVSIITFHPLNTTLSPLKLQTNFNLILEALPPRRWECNMTGRAILPFSQICCDWLCVSGRQPVVLRRGTVYAWVGVCIDWSEGECSWVSGALCLVPDSTCNTQDTQLVLQSFLRRNTKTRSCLQRSFVSLALCVWVKSLTCYFCPFPQIECSVHIK